MDYQKIDELLLKIKSAYESIGAETELVVEEPASIAEVESIENIIERKLPLQIRDFFLQYSKKCEFSAWLPDGFELPSELDEIFSANFLISLEEFADAEKARNGWVENCFTNEEDEYDAVWYNKSLRKESKVVQTKKQYGDFSLTALSFASISIFSG